MTDQVTTINGHRVPILARAEFDARVPSDLEDFAEMQSLFADAITEAGLLDVGMGPVHFRCVVTSIDQEAADLRVQLTGTSAPTLPLTASERAVCRVADTHPDVAWSGDLLAIIRRLAGDECYKESETDEKET